MDKENHKNRIFELAKRWKDGVITPEEKVEFEEWYNSFDDSILELAVDDDIESIKGRIFSTIENNIHLENPKKKNFQFPFLITAVSLIFFIP